MCVFVLKGAHGHTYSCVEERGGCQVSCFVLLCLFPWDRGSISSWKMQWASCLSPTLPWCWGYSALAVMPSWDLNSGLYTCTTSTFICLAITRAPLFKFWIAFLAYNFNAYFGIRLNARASCTNKLILIFYKPLSYDHLWNNTARY